VKASLRFIRLFAAATLLGRSDRRSVYRIDM
jgi:hypothetical protein